MAVTLGVLDPTCGGKVSDDAIRPAAQRRRGVRADRDRLVTALMRSSLKRKTQAAIAERIADLEELDTIPRDLVSRVFREQTVDAPSIARIAAALDVDPLSLYKNDDPRDRAQNDTPQHDNVAAQEDHVGDAVIPARRPAFSRLLAGTTLAVALIAGAVALTSLTLSAQSEAQAGQRTLQGFYAEIGNVYRHYLYSEDELVADPADRNFDLHLGMAQYGDFAFTRTEVARIGMNPDEIRIAMELLLLVRNNDLRIAEMRSGSAMGKTLLAQKAGTLRTRMKDSRDAAYTLLASLHDRRAMTGILPPQPENYVPTD